MEEILGRLAQVVTPAFAILTMLAMGMGLTLREVLEPLRNWRFVAAALALNFVLLPAAAFLAAEVLRLEPDVRIGLVLVSAVAGAPMIPKLVQIAKGDTAAAVALVALLVAATVVYAPIALPLLLPGVQVDSGAIVVALTWQMLLPLAAGIFVRERYPEEAAAYRDEVATLSNIALLLLVIVSVGQNIGGLLGLFGSGGILAIALLIAAAVAGGYVLGVPAGVERRVLALGAAQRNLAAAFIIAAGSFANREVVLSFIAVAGIVMMVALFPLAGEWSKRSSRLEETERETQPGSPMPSKPVRRAANDRGRRRAIQRIGGKP